MLIRSESVYGADEVVKQMQSVFLMNDCNF